MKHKNKPWHIVSHLHTAFIIKIWFPGCVARCELFVALRISAAAPRTQSTQSVWGLEYQAGAPKIKVDKNVMIIIRF